MKRFGTGWWVALAAAAAAVRLCPVNWCSRGWVAVFQGEAAVQDELSRGVERQVLGDTMHRDRFRTGSAEFNGEWLFGSYLMAGMGFGQVALEHPDRKADMLPRMDACIRRLLEPATRAFDTERWREDALESLDGPRGHAAYLGYLNLLLGLHRLVNPQSPHAELNDRITSALARRVEARSTHFIETYPDETYPVDNCFVAGSIGLHGRVTGTNRDDLLRRWSEQARRLFIDGKTGLLIQAADGIDGHPLDYPRGSGTALGLYAVRFADPALSRDLYAAVKRELAGTWLGFGAVREYPRGLSGWGDIDSGPVVLGYSVSATGFCLAGARMYGDASYFSRLFASAHLGGAPHSRGGRREYVTGGPLGNAILFAMMTAPRLDASGREADWK